MAALRPAFKAFDMQALINKISSWGVLRTLSYPCSHPIHALIMKGQPCFSSSGCHPYAYPQLKSWGKGTPDCCRWDGLECNKDTGHVIELDLSSSCLYSTVPSSSSLLNLHHLESLNLGYNNFSYPEILHAVGQLGKLSILNLSNSIFSGQIPSEISTLSSLCVLDLALNSDPLGHYSLLELQHPSLEELLTYPQLCLLSENLTSLRATFLGFCNLYDEFQSSIFNLPKLEVMSFAGNIDLEGSLPEFHPTVSEEDWNYI
ncbi:hypothetical protein Cgig2_004025 [Carnegiea gigantea]|uniref:Leucine-rich repeat-containing N-terminal plant-type domain-containing protein n=1 Tax=Carnegiea gigantea TaxID=171969 RepID=A0A9Q1KSD0_9CARY|nr:hypothetical protein Cgig2_004025 [Carnegiea gigantea]